MCVPSTLSGHEPVLLCKNLKRSATRNFLESHKLMAVLSKGTYRVPPHLFCPCQMSFLGMAAQAVSTLITSTGGTVTFTAPARSATPKVVGGAGLGGDHRAGGGSAGVGRAGGGWGQLEMIKVGRASSQRWESERGRRTSVVYIPMSFLGMTAIAVSIVITCTGGAVTSTVHARSAAPEVVESRGARLGLSHGNGWSSNVEKVGDGSIGDN